MTTYVASPPSEDPVERLRELNIQIRHLKALLAEADDEIAKRDATIQELTIDLIQAEQQAARAKPPPPTPERAPTVHAGRKTGVLTKLCLCGADAEPGKTHCGDCKPQRDRSSDAPPKHKHLHTTRWTKLSKRLRKASPFCESCGTTTDLVVDHIIPLSERADLAYEPLNCRVLCRTENASRRATCTDEERQMVLDRIAARKRRRTAI